MNIKVTQYKMAPRVMEIIREFKKNLLVQFEQEILKIVVFGSYAKGKETSESDLDILVVVKNKELEKQIDDIAYKIMWDFDFAPLLSVYVVSEDYFNYIKKIRTGFYESIEEEGIEVWMKMKITQPIKVQA